MHIGIYSVSTALSSLDTARGIICPFKTRPAMEDENAGGPMVVRAHLDAEGLVLLQFPLKIYW